MTKKYNFIDALRGLAILMVIVVHAGKSPAFHYASWIQSITAAGSKGVQLFFVTSAFTLFLSWQSHKKNERYPTLNFYLRRFFRIAPMYYLGIAYYLWQQGFWDENMHHITTGSIFANFFFIHGIFPAWINNLVPGGWSITVEMMFYLLIPLLVAKITSLDRAVIWLSCSILFNLALQKILFGMVVPHNEEGMAFMYFFLPNQVPVFICGIASYFIVMKQDYHISNIAKVMLAVSVCMVAISGRLSTDPLLAGLLFMSFPFILNKVKGSVIIVNQFFTHLGKISYSAYLVHFAVLYFLGKYGIGINAQAAATPMALLDFLINLALVLSITAIIATVCYNFIELPMQQVGRMLIHRIARYKSGKREMEHEVIPLTEDNTNIPGHSILL